MSKATTSVTCTRATLAAGFAGVSLAACFQSALGEAMPSEGWSKASRRAGLVMQRGDVGSAARLYQQALSLAERDNVGSEHIINLLVNQSEAYIRMKSFPEAQFCLNRAGILIRKEKLGHSPVAMRFHRRLSRLYEGQGKLREAAEEQKKLIQLTDEVFGGNTQKTIQELRHLQALQEWGKMYPDVLSTGLRLLQLMEDFQFRPTARLWSDTGMSTGKAYFELQQYEEAKKYFKFAYDKCTGRGDIDYARHCAISMMQVYERVSDFPNMAKWATTALTCMSRQPQDQKDFLDQKTLVSVQLARALIEQNKFEPFAEKELRIALKRENQSILAKHDLDSYGRKALILQYLIQFLIHRGDFNEAIQLANYFLPAGLCKDMSNIWPFIYIHKLIADEYERRGDYRQMARKYDDAVRVMDSQKQVRDWSDWITGLKFARALSLTREKMKTGMPAEKAYAEIIKAEGLPSTDDFQLWSLTQNFSEANFKSHAELALQLAVKRFEKEGKPSNADEATIVAKAIDHARLRGVDVSAATAIAAKCNRILGRK